MTWPGKILALNNLLKNVGPLWPESTKLSGYGTKGPYHCGHCRYLEGADNCSHPVVNADPQVKKDAAGNPLVDADRGCCEFVDPE